MHLCKFHMATNIPIHMVSSFPFFAYNSLSLCTKIHSKNMKNSLWVISQAFDSGLGVLQKTISERLSQRSRPPSFHLNEVRPKFQIVHGCGKNAQARKTLLTRSFRSL